MDTWPSFNVHEKFMCRPASRMNVLCSFNLDRTKNGVQVDKILVTKRFKLVNILFKSRIKMNKKMAKETN